MPSPEQERKERIGKLLAEFNGKNITTIDSIYNRALELFPHLTERRAKDYAKAVLRMLKTTEKKKSG